MTIIKDELRDHQEKIRHAAPDADRARRRRDRHRGSDRQRGRIITITHNGLIKRTDVSTYRAQRRGGKGVIGMTTREARTRGGAGRFRRASLHRHHARLPDVLHQDGPLLRRARPRNSRHGPRRQGPSIANLLELKPDEKIAAPIRIQARARTDRRGNVDVRQLHIVFATATGTVKKSNLVGFRQHPQGRHHRHPDRGGRPS